MEDKIDIKNLINKITVETKFSPILLEKDYHLTKILNEVGKKQIKDLVFKGGTCLSKCYLDFYRLSEDLDFVYNKDVKDLTKNQVRKILGNIRREFFEILGELGLKIDKGLGKSWKMLTLKKPPCIVGLEITTSYNSLIDNSPQTIKIEISFRRKLRKLIKERIIKHKFYNALKEPILNENIKIEVIDLIENFAEKFRALYTRKKIAVRDLYDINHILISEIKLLDKEIFNLIILKINETHNLSKKEFIEFIKNLRNQINNYDIKELEAVLRTDEKVDIDKIIERIEKFFGIER